MEKRSTNRKSRSDYYRDWVAKNRERVREYKREWKLRNPDKVKAARERNSQWMKGYLKEYANSPEGKEVNKRAHEAYKQRFPDRVRARSIANNALIAGEMEYGECEVCGCKAEMHHDDYDFPLDVRWLCFQHHREVHREV